MQSVNLYPQEMRPRRQLLTLAQVVGAALLTLLLVMLNATYVRWQATEALVAQQTVQTRNPQLRQAVTAAQQRLDERRADPALTAELEQLSSDLRSQERLLQWVEQFASEGTEGFSPVLAGLARQAVDGVWLTALEIDRNNNNLALTGLTRDARLVPLFLEQLRRESAFAGRRFRQFELARPGDKGDGSDEGHDSQVLGFYVAGRPAKGFLPAKGSQPAKGFRP